MKKLLLACIVVCFGLLSIGCTSQEERLLPFHQNGKFGFANKEGQVVIEPKYEGFRDIEYGVRNVAGKLSPIWREFGSRAPVVPNFNIVQNEGCWGVIDNNEEILVPLQYSNVSKYDGKILVMFRSDGSYDIYDIAGSVLLEDISKVEVEEYLRNPDTNAKLIPKEIDGKYGFVDKEENIMIEPDFEQAWYFKDGVAMVRQNSKYGYIDEEGNIIIEPKFDQAWPFKEGLAMIKQDTKYGYIDEEGVYFIEPCYYEASNFNEGVAAVKDRRESRFYYIDTDGNKIEGIESDVGFSCIDGIIRTLKYANGEVSYMTTDGKVIFQYLDWFKQP